MADQTVTAKFVADISSFQSNLRALQASARELKASAADMSSSLSQSSTGINQASNAATNAARAKRELGNAARESKQGVLSLVGGFADMVEEIGEVVGAVGQVVAALATQREAVITTTRAFNSLTLNVAETKKQMQELSQLSSAKAFGTQEIQQAALHFGRLGKDAATTKKEIELVGNALAAAGQDSKNLVPIIEKMHEIQQSTNITKKDIDELARLGIASWAELEHATGKSQKQIEKEIQSGAMSGKEAYAALLEGMQRDMGAAEAKSHDLSSSMGRLGESMGQAFSGPIDELAKLIDKLAELEQKAHLVSGTLKFIFAPGMLAGDLIQGAFGAPGHASGIQDNPVGHGGWVGEDGPEFMWIPERATIFPNGMSPLEQRSSTSGSVLPALNTTMSGAPLQGGGYSGPVTFQVYLDSRMIAEQTAPHLAPIIRAFSGRRR